MNLAMKLHPDRNIGFDNDEVQKNINVIMGELNQSFDLINNTFKTSKKPRFMKSLQEAEQKRWEDICRSRDIAWDEIKRKDFERKVQGKNSVKVKRHSREDIEKNVQNTESRRSENPPFERQQKSRSPEITSKPQAPSLDDDVEMDPADNAPMHTCAGDDSDDAMDIDEPTVEINHPAHASTTETPKTDIFNSGEKDAVMSSPRDPISSTCTRPDVYDSMALNNSGRKSDDQKENAGKTESQDAKRRREKFDKSSDKVLFHNPIPRRNKTLPYQEIRYMNDLAYKVPHDCRRTSEDTIDPSSQSRPNPRLPGPPRDDSPANLKVYEHRLCVFSRYVSTREHTAVRLEPAAVNPTDLERQDVKLLQRRCGPFLLIAESSDANRAGIKSLEMLFDIIREQNESSMIIIDERVDNIPQRCRNFFENLKDGDKPCIIILYHTSKEETKEDSKGDDKFGFLYSQLEDSLYPSVVISLLKPRTIQSHYPASLPSGSVVFTTTGLGFLEASSEFIGAFFHPTIQISDAVFCSILHGNEIEADERLWFVGMRRIPYRHARVVEVSIDALVHDYPKALAKDGYRPHHFHDTLEPMKASWPHHTASLQHVHDNVLDGNTEALFDDPLSRRSTKAFILGLEIERCRSQTLETLTKEPLRESVWLKNQRYLLIEGPRCPRKMRLSSKLMFGAKLERYNSTMWFNERDITLRWKTFQASLRPGDVICVVLSVQTNVRVRNGVEEVIVADGYAGMEFKDLLPIFSSYHWVNLVLIAQHASTIASEYGTFLPDRTCLLTADSSIGLSVNPSASFLCICLHRIIHSPAEPTMRITWNLDGQVMRLELDEYFEEQTRSAIFDKSCEVKVCSTLKATIGFYEYEVIEHTFNALIFQEGKRGSRSRRSKGAQGSNASLAEPDTIFRIPPKPIALALAFQVIKAAEVI